MIYNSPCPHPKHAYERKWKKSKYPVFWNGLINSDSFTEEANDAYKHYCEGDMSALTLSV